MHAGTILIATPDAAEREAMTRALARKGHRVISAENGKRALQLLASEQPDVALLALSLPLVDGFEVARTIRSQTRQDAPVPVVFLVSPPVETALTQGLAAGGEDFLMRPFPWLLLCAKVAALVRLRRRLLAVSERLARLESEHDELKHEVEAAERLFTKMAWDESLSAPNLRYLSWPKALANGDILLAGATPHGVQHLLLGDFTGHGLTAALGTTPVIDVFQTMTRKGCLLGDIAREINDKLHAKLPRGKFLAACLVALDGFRGTLEVWNGGMPEVLIYRPGVGLAARVPSGGLPLGIAAGGTFNPERLRLEAGDRVFLCSDGVLEACNWNGDMFGEQRLRGCFTPQDGASPFDVVERELARFRAGKPQRDDMTLVEIACSNERARAGSSVGSCEK
jgi:serine phosphatase RsbU (regulator of sigma subunit)